MNITPEDDEAADRHAQDVALLLGISEALLSPDLAVADVSFLGHEGFTLYAGDIHMLCGEEQHAEFQAGFRLVLEDLKSRLTERCLVYANRLIGWVTDVAVPAAGGGIKPATEEAPTEAPASPSVPDDCPDIQF